MKPKEALGSRCRWQLVPALALMLGSACGEQPQQTPVHTIYGSITSSTIVANNRPAWVKLVGEQDSLEALALYSTSCYLQGPSCDYQLLFVAEGNYTVYAIIDMDGDMVDPELLPDGGDLVSGARPLFLMEKTRLDFGDEVWRVMP